MIRDKHIDSGQRITDGQTIRGNYAPISEPSYDAENPLLDQDKPIRDFGYLTDEISDRAAAFITRQSNRPYCLVVSYNAVHSPMQAKTEDVDRFESIDDVQRRIFAGMVHAMDQGIGRILNSLDRSKQRKRTLVVFLSDNGGPTKELTSSNLPLRGEKGSLYEGGIRVPMIWSMPGTVPQGVDEHRPVLSLDVAATILSQFERKTNNLLDGIDALPWLGRPDVLVPKRKLFWRMTRGKIALRAGEWKIVRPSSDSPIELYRLSNDIAETTNLASQFPQRTKEMWQDWQTINAEMQPPMQ
jgi:arylsulfatase B